MATELKCSLCDAVVEYPDFECKKQPGGHTVPSKTYYHLGGSHIQDQRSRRLFSPNIILVPAYDRADPETGKALSTQGLSVEFADGRFTTSVAREQYYLNKREPTIVSGDEGLKQWNAVYLSPEAQKDIASKELASVQRQIKEANDLLAATKQQKQNQQARA